MIFFEMAFEVNKYFMAQYTTHTHIYTQNDKMQTKIYL